MQEEYYKEVKLLAGRRVQAKLVLVGYNPLNPLFEIGLDSFDDEPWRVLTLSLSLMRRTYALEIRVRGREG